MAKIISFLSCSINQGSLRLTHGRFICLLDFILAEFRAFTSKKSFVFPITFTIKVQESIIILFHIFISPTRYS